MNKKNPNFTIYTPEGFGKVELPYFKEWLEDLKSSPPQCKKFLKDEDAFCCLGRLCYIQGRLSEDGCDDGELYYLSSTNPCYSIFGNIGRFPGGCYVEKSGEIQFDFASCNDKLELTMVEIAQVLETFYKPLSNIN